MILMHYRDILVDLLPSGVKYSIPLILPQEQLLFRTTQLVVTLPLRELPEVDYEKLKEVLNKREHKEFQIKEMK